MLASQRKQQILAILARDKQVHSTELSQQFQVSEDSIRRDLRELAAAGLFHRQLRRGGREASAQRASLGDYRHGLAGKN